MVLINDNYLRLPESYLFSDIKKKVTAFKASHPEAKIISLGIGDVTRPIAPVIIEALHSAVDEMGHPETFRGYGPEQGYSFLQEKIVENDFKARGVELDTDEVFISDGAKSDIGNIGDILSVKNKIAVTDPVYPVYVDTNVMGGRAGIMEKDGQHWSDIIYIPCTSENNFVPDLPAQRPDVIYLCYPNNPTGTTLLKEELEKWVDYALENDSLILFDAAYEAFIHDENIPHSIYEIPHAKRVAIEFRSFSKTAGFTGLRCGYTVVPKSLRISDESGKRVEVNKLWNRRQTTKFNGTSYIVQRAAEAIYSPEGKKQIQESIEYYMRNARLLKNCLQNIGLQLYGGDNAPYIWVKTPNRLSSWKFFDRLLNECHIVGTPGIGFGPSGEGYFRLTAFGRYEDTVEAISRIQNWKL
ncbi:MAG TPA: LL-diaminopimelate aminotransferase [Candidatus Barnesiella excrementigallinarum]|nr:LL-diaminopimelate aminotransferase [Candidatus Barnesiella excrementigallinarum]